MANLKLLLDTRRQKSDGTFNVIFRIIHQRKSYSISSGISILESDWNFKKNEIHKSHPNAKIINLSLSKKYFEIQNEIIKLDKNFNINLLKSILNGHSLEEQTNFFDYSEKLISKMLAIRKTGNAIVYQTAVNKLLQYSNNPKLKFSEIDYAYLEHFKHSLILQGLKTNSISNYFRSIRAIYNKAIKEKLVDRSLYPFFDIKISSEKTSKRAISKQDIILLELSLNKLDEKGYKAVKLFLLSFYLRGISFTDLAYLKHSDIVGDRILYKRRKTHKEYSIKLFPKAKEIISYFSQEKYLLPIIPESITEDSLEAKKLINQWIKNTNKHLKKTAVYLGIESSITTYVARHTFATTAKKLGYSNELIAEALGHEYGNKITNIYLDDFDTELLDEMHQRIIKQ